MDQSAFSTELTVSLMHDLKQYQVSSVAKYSDLIVLTIRFISIFLNCRLKYSSITLLTKKKKVLLTKKTSEIYHLINNTPPSNRISTLLP